MRLHLSASNETTCFAQHTPFVCTPSTRFDFFLELVIFSTLQMMKQNNGLVELLFSCTDAQAVFSENACHLKIS